jgi:predicted O-methyltransferase YrrM
MHFISEALEAYAEKHSDDEPALLAALNRETQQKILHSQMLSGHLQGRLLSMLSKLAKPSHILEIGTYTGYATLCLAEGLAENGTIDTIDINEELYDFQRSYFDRSPWRKQIKQHVGKALDIIPSIDKKFDLVFIDADKENYASYFELIVPKMSKGGLILSDNVLWKGKILDAVDDKDKKTKALAAYNLLLKDDSRVETLLLPIRDGLTVCRVI